MPKEYQGRSAASPCWKLVGIILGGFCLTEIKAHTEVKTGSSTNNGGTEFNKTTITATINRGILMNQD